MINPSKIKSQRMWDIWNASGAVESIDDAIARDAVNPRRLNLVEITGLKIV